MASIAPHPVVGTQGHALNTVDFTATLAVEAAIHHLDMIAQLYGAPPTASGCLSLVRRTLDGLPGDMAGRFPLFG